MLRRTSNGGVLNVTMAHVVLIHLTLICPAIRMLSVAKKAEAAPHR
jgi:hypothetical protein